MTDKLTMKEKYELTIQSSLNLIPYVGGALSSAYFSTKQEKRFKRIESFYQELAQKIEHLEIEFPPFSVHDEEAITSLIEHLNDKIEKEHSEQKRKFFKNFFVNSLITPTNETTYDQRRIYLEILGNITYLEFQVLLTYSNEHRSQINPEISKEVIDGARARLEMFGLLNAQYRGETRVGSTPVNKYVHITNFAIDFINFCMR